MVFADSIAKWRVGKTGLFKQFLALGLLAGLTIVVYFPSLHYSFLNYDDDEYVTANANVRSGLNLASLKWAFEHLPCDTKFNKRRSHERVIAPGRVPPPLNINLGRKG
jgi:hypothetical protein